MTGTGRKRNSGHSVTRTQEDPSRSGHALHEGFPGRDSPPRLSAADEELPSVGRQSVEGEGKECRQQEAGGSSKR